MNAVEFCNAMRAIGLSVCIKLEIDETIIRIEDDYVRHIPIGNGRVCYEDVMRDYFDFKRNRDDRVDVLRYYPKLTWYDVEVNGLFNQPVKYAPEIEKVIFNKPATIVIWKDGTKTIVKCQKGDRYDKEKGLAMCIAKKTYGNNGNYCEIFKEWLE